MGANEMNKKAKEKDDDDRSRSPPRRPPTKVINVVTKGSVIGGARAYYTKKYARSPLDSKEQGNDPKMQSYQITWDDVYLRGVLVQQDDGLVVTQNIEDMEVKRVFIDTRSSADLLYYEAFVQMGILESTLEPISRPIKGITGTSPYSLVKLRLKVRFRETTYHVDIKSRIPGGQTWESLQCSH